MATTYVERGLPSTMRLKHFLYRPHLIWCLCDSCVGGIDDRFRRLAQHQLLHPNQSIGCRVQALIAGVPAILLDLADHRLPNQHVRATKELGDLELLEKQGCRGCFVPQEAVFLFMPKLP